MSKMWIQVRPLDPTTFAMVAVGLAGFAVLACHPARRATRVDPLTTLRDE
jgi:ABC-type lipoprotein release transport system permease subunit